MPVTKNIFIFGDSITYGEWDDNGGWANRIRQHYDRQILPTPDDYMIIYNLGIPSDTSTGLADRLELETRSRLSPNPGVKAIQFVIAIGANDARWLTEDNCRGVELEQYKTNLTVITKAAQRFSNDIVFVGLLPCIEEDVLHASTKHGWIETYTNVALSDYNNALKQYCLDNAIQFIDLFDTFNTHPESLFSDGLHPNNAGHQLICEYVLAFLEGNTKP